MIAFVRSRELGMIGVFMLARSSSCSTSSRSTCLSACIFHRRWLRPSHLRRREVHPVHDRRQRVLMLPGHPRPRVPAQHDRRTASTWRGYCALRPRPASGSSASRWRSPSSSSTVPHVATRRARRAPTARSCCWPACCWRSGHPGLRAVRVSAPAAPPPSRAFVAVLAVIDHLRRARSDGAADVKNSSRILEHQPSRFVDPRHHGDEHQVQGGAQILNSIGTAASSSSSACSDRARSSRSSAVEEGRLPPRRRLSSSSRCRRSRSSMNRFVRRVSSSSARSTDHAGRVSAARRVRPQDDVPCFSIFPARQFRRRRRERSTDRRIFEPRESLVARSSPSRSF